MFIKGCKAVLQSFTSQPVHLKSSKLVSLSIKTTTDYCSKLHTK